MTDLYDNHTPAGDVAPGGANFELPLQSTIPDMLLFAAERYCARTFIEVGQKNYTYSQVLSDSLRWARGFAQQGIGKGDIVACIMDTSYEFVLTFFALGRLGAIWMPVNPAFKGEFLKHQLIDSTACAIIVDEKYHDRVGAISGHLATVKKIFYRGNRVAEFHGEMNYIPLAQVDTNENQYDPPSLAPSDTFALLYTSGTTGPSKGCIVSHNYMYNNGRQSYQHFQRDDVLFNPLPIFHLNALNMICSICLSGAKIVLIPRFSVSSFWDEIERTNATVCNLLGAMIKFIADAPDRKSAERCRGQLRLAQGVPFPPALQAVWRERFGVRKFRCAAYGQTEANAVTSTVPDEDVPAGSMGRPTEEFEVKIFDDDDNELPPGSVGEIVCRPRRNNVMFDGYWQRPEATVSAFRNLWYHTGDLGRMDEDGAFYFVDRKKDYIRRRGENISSFEVEAAFLLHPKVAEVAATAVPAPEGEDELKITVVLQPGSHLSEEDLCSWSMDRLPYFAVPRFLEFRESLPRNAVDRVMKHHLRSEGVSETTWDLERSNLVVERR